MSKQSAKFHHKGTSFAVVSLLLLAYSGLLFSSRYTPPAVRTKPVLTPPPVASAAPGRPSPKLTSYANLPLIFEKNEGQTDSSVQFLARGSGYAMFLSGRELVMRFDRRPAADTGSALALIRNRRLAPVEPAEQLSVRMRLQGSNPAPESQGLERLPGLSHYFIGNDPKKWHSNVPQYGKVQYRGVYPGIDAVYYDNHHRLEYDFVVAPGADPHAIRLAFDGVDRLRLDAEGNLVLSAGGEEFRQARPIVSQTIDGRVRHVPVRYEIAAATREVTLALADYDRTRTLTVDPVLDYFSYLGSSGLDQANFITIDSAGNALLTGVTSSVGTSPNPNPFPQRGSLPNRALGNYDAFLTRIGTDGSGNMVLLSSTFLGGSGTDQGFGIALDLFNNIYLVGETTSKDFPAQSSGVFQSSNQTQFSGGYTGFAVKLNPTASGFLYSTYLGVPLPPSFGAPAGSGDDHAYAVAVDGNFNAYIAGKSSGGSPPPSAPETFCGTDLIYGGYVLKLNSAGSAVTYSTQLAGFNGGSCTTSIVVDSTGSVYALGNGNADDLLITTAQLSGTFVVPAFQPTYGGGTMDMFVAKLGPTGLPNYLSFLGGSGFDFTTYSTLAVDGGGNAYVTGGTTSPNLPGTAGSLQPGPHSHTPCVQNGEDICAYDAFVAKVNPSGTQLLNLTYFGGSMFDVGAGLVLDAKNNIYITGITQSLDFPAPVPFRLQTQVGQASVFLAEIKPDFTQSLYATYFGGNGEVLSTALAARPQSNDIYIAGVAVGGPLQQVPQKGPATSLFSGYQGGTLDAFLAKLTNVTLGATGRITRQPIFLAPGEPKAPVGSTPYSLVCQAQNKGNNTVDNPTINGRVCPECQLQSCASSDPNVTCKHDSQNYSCTGTGSLGPGGTSPACTGNFTTASASPSGVCQPFSDSHDTDAGNNSITVVPSPDFEIDTSPLTTGVRVLVDGVQQVSPYQGNWVASTNHTLNVFTSPGAPIGVQNGADPNARLKFASWIYPGGPSFTTPITVNVANDSILTHFTANFNTQFRLFLSSSSGCPSPTTLPVADGYYDASSTVMLTAPGCSSQTFQSWNVPNYNFNVCPGQPNCITITMPPAGGALDSVTVTAVYGPITGPTATSITLLNSPNQSNAGQLVNLTANVTPSTATGTVTFFDGAAPVAVIALINGTAAASVSFSAGNHTLTATYNGSANYLGSTSSPASQSVIGTNNAPPLRFVPLPPCRVLDTRGPTGPLGGPQLAPGSRDFPILSSSCGLPFNASAYSMNVTVVPQGGLGYLSIWGTGQPQPLVSTLNSDGRVKADAAIVPAGAGGAISIFVTDRAHVIIDINGYFVPAATAGSLSFYPVAPCRVMDTRNPIGLLGGPSFGAGQSRTMPVLASPCNIPSSARAYSLNYTVVPQGPLGYITTWPTGSTMPLVSTLNDLNGTITANAAIVPAGTNGGVDVFATNNTDLIVDINGYFAPPGAAGGLSFYAVAPCRVVDTRNPIGSLGGPSISGSRDLPVSSSGCNVPAAAMAYSLNATVVPRTVLGFLTMWPFGGPMPLVSTLNALDGSITSNAAIVPAASGSMSAFVTNLIDLILDINGYFAP